MEEENILLTILTAVVASAKLKAEIYIDLDSVILFGPITQTHIWCWFDKGELIINYAEIADKLDSRMPQRYWSLWPFSSPDCESRFAINLSDPNSIDQLTEFFRSIRIYMH